MRTRVLGRASLALGLALSVFPIAGSFYGVAAGPAAKKLSPTDNITIVTVNLLEGFDEQDVQKSPEIDVFVNRVLDQVPFDPDIVLLQEVRASTAKRVANKFAAKTNGTYKVAVNAAIKPYVKKGGHAVKADTAIVINTATIQKISGGYIKTEHDIPGEVPFTKKNARGLFKEINGTLQVAAVSVHVSEKGITPTVKTIAKKLEAVHPADPLRYQVLGGDFNTNGIQQTGGFGQTKEHEFWNHLTSAPYRYIDSIWNVKHEKGVDYVFVRGDILKAGLDLSYNAGAAEGDPSRFYSDHRFRWAVVGPDLTPPTAPTNLFTFSNDNTPLRVKIGWNPTNANDFSEYDVYRSPNNDNDFKKIGSTSNDDAYYDYKVDKGKTYDYYVVTRDYSNNESPPSATVKETAGSGP